MLLTPFLLNDALVGKAKPHVLLVDFGLAEIFDEQVGPFSDGVGWGDGL